MPDTVNTGSHVSVRLIRDWHLETPARDGRTFYPADQFLLVDPTVAEKLIETETAIKQTQEEYDAEQKRERERKAWEDQKTRNEAQKYTVVEVRSALKDNPRGGFDHLGDFAVEVAKASRPGNVRPDRLAKWIDHVEKETFANEGIDSEGGFLVPPQFLTELKRTEIENSIVEPRATVIPMSSSSIKINALVDEDHSSNLYGGVTLYRPEEGGEKTLSKPTFRQVELNPHKLTGLVACSDELIQDSPISIGPLMTALFGSAMSWQKDYDFLQGTGVGQPRGVLNSAALISITAEAGQIASTIVIDNVLKMLARLHPRSLSNAVWLYNPTCLVQLCKLSLPVGTGGSAVFMPPGGVSQSPYATLFGRPMIPTEKLPALGSAGQLLLADFSQYLVGLRGSSPEVASSIHLYFAYDKTAFRFVSRYDGQTWWRTTLTPKNGDSLSPFLKLGAVS